MQLFGDIAISSMFELVREPRTPPSRAAASVTDCCTPFSYCLAELCAALAGTQHPAMNIGKSCGDESPLVCRCQLWDVDFLKWQQPGGLTPWAISHCWRAPCACAVPCATLKRPCTPAPGTSVVSREGMSEDDLCLIREESKMQWPFSNRERLYLYERQMTREGELLYTCKSCTPRLLREVRAPSLHRHTETTRQAHIISCPLRFLPCVCPARSQRPTANAQQP